MKIKKYDIEQYRYAKKIDKDFPVIITILEECFRKLKPYRGYVSVHMALESLNDCAESVTSNYDYYKKILIKKGET